MIKTVRYFIILLAFSAQAYGSNLIEELAPHTAKFARFMDNPPLNPFNPQSIHAFNRLARPFAEFLRLSNTILMTEDPLSPRQILDQLSVLRVAHNYPDHIEEALEQIRVYIAAGSDYDAETNMNLNYLLRTVWSYMQNDGPEALEGNLSELFFYVGQNVYEGGGCFPGHVGRLMFLNGLHVLRNHRAQMEYLGLPYPILEEEPRRPPIGNLPRKITKHLPRGFHAQAYIDMYPDIIRDAPRFKMDPFTFAAFQYVKWGRSENRIYLTCPLDVPADFNAEAYCLMYPDVEQNAKKYCMQPLIFARVQYFLWGRQKGRLCLTKPIVVPDDFNAEQYLHNHPRMYEEAKRFGVEPLIYAMAQYSQWGKDEKNSYK